MAKKQGRTVTPGTLGSLVKKRVVQLGGINPLDVKRERKLAREDLIKARKALGEDKYREKLYETIKAGLEVLKDKEYELKGMSGKFIIDPRLYNDKDKWVEKIDLKTGEVKKVFEKSKQVTEKTRLQTLEKLYTELKSDYILANVQFSSRELEGGLKVLRKSGISPYLVYKPYEDTPRTQASTFTIEELIDIQKEIAKTKKVREELGAPDLYNISSNGIITTPITATRTTKFEDIIIGIRERRSKINIEKEYARIAKGLFRSLAEYIEEVELYNDEHDDLMLYAIKKIMNIPLEQLGRMIYGKTFYVDFRNYLDSDTQVFETAKLTDFYDTFNLDLNEAKNELKKLYDKKVEVEQAKENGETDYSDLEKELDEMEANFKVVYTERQSYLDLVSERALNSVKKILDRIDANETK